MYKARITAALGSVAVVLMVAACAGNSHPAAGSAHPVQETSSAVDVFDPNGLGCATLDSLGYCPGDDPAPQVTDPSGQSCATLDSSGYCPGDDPPPAPTMTKQTDKIVFRVTGSGYPSIQYGTDSSNNQATGGNGPLGDGNALPWTASMDYDPSALYIVVTAQLEGGGSISDTVTEVVETWCSDGTHKTESFPLAHGSASGGYTIASAQYNSLGSSTGNAEQAESDAGC
jgi:hypothetical protein